MARVGSRNIAQNTTLIIGKWFSFHILKVSSESDLLLYRKLEKDLIKINRLFLDKINYND